MRGGRGRGRGRGGFRSSREGPQETPAIYKPREQFPTMDMPRAPIFSTSEKEVIGFFNDFRDQMHNSPIFTVLETDICLQRPGELSGSFGSKDKEPPKSKFESPFESVQIYTSRYNPPKLALPKLEGRKYDKDFFPPELHSLIGPSSPAQVARPSKRIKVEEGEAEKVVGEEEEEDLLDPEEDEEFDEDDEDGTDAGDDYNAEKYFDNGEDDGFDDDGGGGDYE